MQNNMFQQFQQFRQNPMQWRASRGMQVPQQIAGDPNAIIQYMMNNGKLSQEQYNQAAQMAQQMQNQFPR